MLERRPYKPYNLFQKLFTLLAALFLLITGSAFETAPAAKQEAGKRRMVRQENFLLRAYEELDKSLEYQKAVIVRLEKRNLAGAGADLKQYLDWQRTCAAWLRERLSESGSDLENFYSHKMIRPFLAARHSAMAEDYTRLKSELSQMMLQLEEAKVLNAAEIQKLLRIIEFYEYLNEQTLKKKIADEKRIPDRKPPDGWTFFSGGLNDDKIEQMGLKIKKLDELQKELDDMLEFGNYELHWLVLKSGDSAAISSVADALATDSLDEIEIASTRMISRYESDISFIDKKLGEMDGKRLGLAPGTGTMRTIDRREELWDYYWTMKDRFEHHKQWLKEQVGGYRADIVLLSKEKSEK